MLTSALAPRTTSLPITDDLWFSRWRAAELGRLNDADLTYLDYTGAALYAESLIRRDAERLISSTLGNPHSQSIPSRASTGDLESARDAILAFVNASADEYVVVLTANTSTACRIVGESYPFDANTPLVLSADNHNSVNGLREFARRGGAPVHTMPLDAELRLDAAQECLRRHAGSSAGLVGFPAQSNFSGVRHPLRMIDEAQALGYRVLLDAAAYLPTAVLDLSEVKPDYVVLSIYKIAGYPTGIGALIARRDALSVLRRPWFSGGTVDWVTVATMRHQLSAGPERFEDGTPSFLAAGAVRSALAGVIYADRERLGSHLRTLTAQLLDRLTSLRHSNGSALVQVHGPRTVLQRGATVAITLRDADHDVIPFWQVEDAARAQGIALRGGCFCNPGCAERAFNLGDATRCLDALAGNFSIPAFAHCLGSEDVGAVRISMGLGSISADVDVVVSFLNQYLG